MATVINDLTIEPKVPAAAEAAPPADGGKGGGKSGPELEREVEKVARRDRERTFRLWAH